MFTLCTLTYVKYNINGSKVVDSKVSQERLTNECAPTREILTTTTEFQYFPKNPVTTAPDPVQITITNPTIVSHNNSPWLEYRKKWSGKDLLVDIDDETGILTLVPEYRPRMLTKLHHPLTREYSPFKKRIDLMNAYCDELNSPSTQSMTLYEDARMYFNDNYESVHCAIPKASSRVWLRKFAQMRNSERQWSPEPPPDERILFSLGYHMIPHNMTAKRLQTYTKTIVTRHPFKRIISCFNDKFSKHPLYVNGVNKILISKLYLTDMPANVSEFIAGINTKYSYLNTDTKKNIMLQYMRIEDPYLKLITLIEFLKYLIITWEEEGSTESFDPHWRPIIDLCLPCSFTYDILIEHDRVSQESQLVLNYLQRNNKLNHPLKFDPFTPKTSVSVCNNAFKTVPIDIRRKIFEIYKYDFALFGYKTNLTSDDNLC